MANTVIRIGYVSVTSGGGTSIQEFASSAVFPLVGITGVIYLALDTNKIYRWNQI